ncbi:hypothetical protein CF15_01805 [Pyrodictium occultum]|uniref:HTH marR-type domain-containing protein n=1 Tax=Pyrodictium occultum TaxID=2309 RepID=A0A0V8RUC4_PYROC|nr:helix-turn-helix domain-containing protein [Pyrodictium occultum]KSW11592.1 hypothetical protein CF15_01805 [Pyrodictium occultum]
MAGGEMGAADTGGGLTPSQAAVLLAVYRGVDRVEELARALRLPRETVEDIVGELEAMGMLEEYRSGLIFKRRRLRLTRRGLDAVPEAMRLMEHAAQAAKRLVEARLARQEARRLEAPADAGLPEEELLAIAPLLPMLGLLSAAEALMLLDLLSGLDAGGAGGGG